MAIVAGEKHSCALNSTGAVKCWGQNDRGQLGNGTTTDSDTPVDASGLASGVIALGAGNKHTCAVLSSGVIRCWGHNNHGQLGDGGSADSPVPVDVAALPPMMSVAAGAEHTCGLTPGGGVKCWGRNDKGQLGDGSGSDSATPVDVATLATGAAWIETGEKHSCAAMNSGLTRCWGDNANGQLGNNTTVDSGLPVDVSGLSDAIQIGAGKEFTCALRQAGNVSCWGRNNGGQLGDGTGSDSDVPVDVVGFGGTAPTPTPQPSPTTVSFLAGEDSYVDSTTPGQNFGTETTMRISDVNRSLLKFDVSSIPSGATVTNAELVLCFSSILSLAAGRTHELNRATSSWAEGSVTWSNQPGSTGPAVTWTVPLVTGCTSLDVTAAAQAWVDGSFTNDGWWITDQNESSASILSEVQYATSEDAVLGRRPTLNVTYSP